MLVLMLAVRCGGCLAETAEAERDPAGMFALEGYTTGILLEDIADMDPRTGPGVLYESLASWPFEVNKGDEIKILTQVYSGGILWVLAKVPSLVSRDVRCYLAARSDRQTIQFDSSAVPVECSPDSLVDEWLCSFYDCVTFRLGPWDDMPFVGPFYEPGATAWIVLTDGDWALVEASNRFDYRVKSGIYARRGWVPLEELIY